MNFRSLELNKSFQEVGCHEITWKKTGVAQKTCETISQEFLQDYPSHEDMVGVAYDVPCANWLMTVNVIE